MEFRKPVPKTALFLVGKLFRGHIPRLVPAESHLWFRIKILKARTGEPGNTGGFAPATDVHSKPGYVKP